MRIPVRRLAHKLARGEFYFVFGRFSTFRAFYGACRGNIQRLKNRRFVGVQRGSLFPEVDIERAVECIGRDAVFLDLRLPHDTVSKIETFCRSEPLFARQDPDGPRFHHADVVNGYTPDGRPVAIGPITDPLHCEAVRDVVEDPAIRNIVARYLGYTPHQVLPLPYWSFASRFTDEERRQLLQSVIDYHYDVGGYRFVYVSFYILACDRTSGAHVMMKGSHRRKPLRMLLGSSRASEEAVHRCFGPHNEIMIEGPAGTGFIQDSACYHRATAPTEGDRLLLQIRFS